MNEKLLKYLVQEGLLTQLQADELWKEHISSRRPVRELVLELGAVPEDRVIEALSAVSGLPTVRLYENPIPMEVQQMVRPDLLRTHLVLPFALDPADNRTLFVATNDPMNMRGRDAVAAASRRRSSG